MSSTRRCKGGYRRAQHEGAAIRSSAAAEGDCTVRNTKAIG